MKIGSQCMIDMFLCLIFQTLMSYCSPLSMKLYVDRYQDCKVKVNCSFQLNHLYDVINITINNFDTSTHILTYDNKITNFSKSIRSNIIAFSYVKNTFLCFDYENCDCDVPTMLCEVFINKSNLYPDAEPDVARHIDVRKYDQHTKSTILVDGFWNNTNKVSINSTSQIKNFTCSFEDMCSINDIILSVTPSVEMSTNGKDFHIYRNTNHNLIKAVKSTIVRFNETGRYEVTCIAKSDHNITYIIKKEFLVYRRHEFSFYKSYCIGAAIFAVVVIIAIVAMRMKECFMEKCNPSVLILQRFPWKKLQPEEI